MGLEEDFKAAAERVKPVGGLSNDSKLELYGLYKQATAGDNTASQPWVVQVEARAKWDAWEKKKGMSKEDAMKAYIELVEQLLASSS